MGEQQNHAIATGAAKVVAKKTEQSDKLPDDIEAGINTAKNLAQRGLEQVEEGPKGAEAWKNSPFQFDTGGLGIEQQIYASLQDEED